MVSPEPGRLDWIHRAGILDLLGRILEVDSVTDLDLDLEHPPSAISEALVKDANGGQVAAGSVATTEAQGEVVNGKLEHQGLRRQVGFKTTGGV